MDTAVIGNSPVKQISPSELLPLEENNSAAVPVGSGTYGDCILKKFTRFGITILEKKVPTSDLTAVMNEAQCMNTLTHPAIPHLLGVQIDGKPYSLVMQFLGVGMESVTVHKLLHQDMAKHLLLSTNEWISVLHDISEALFHVHQKGFLHCDVKSNNVLVSGKKGYLIDFGKACLIARPAARKYTSFYNHIASEVLRGRPVSMSSDVFSLGVIIYSVGKALPHACLNSLGKQCKDTKPASRPSIPEV
ncbi:serine threonine- kinase, partial [Paramuricea clavata]